MEALQPARRLSRPRAIFAAAWVLSNAWLLWLVVGQRGELDQTTMLAVLLLGVGLSAQLLWAVPGARPLDSVAATKTRWLPLFLAAAGLALVLFGLRAVAGSTAIVGLPVVGAVTLLATRPRLSRRHVAYALALSAVAAVGAAIGQPANGSPSVWVGLQVCLVALCLSAGWGILRATGLEASGVGTTLLVAEGSASARRGFIVGALIGVPWALLSVVLGAASGDRWVTAWWQPLAAVQPAIAEEAWGRVFLVPLLFLALRRFARARVALGFAVVVAGYWFAYLHAGSGPGAVVTTVMLGTTFSLPLAYLWLRRGLETAIGFHFLTDFVRYAVAYLAVAGAISG